jgi:predicted phosphodiesterase
VPDVKTSTHDPARPLGTRSFERIAVFGGVYSNHLALSAVLADAAEQGVDGVFCLGDVGGFGPHPDRSADILRESSVMTIQGNYDDSVGHALDTCQCGYTDPRDNHFARISYAYTLENTSERNRAWMRKLPRQLRVRLGDLGVLMAHGSPRRVNEFLWESMTPTPFIRRLLREHETELILVTHTGLHWHRLLEDGRRGVVNVGAIGRPPNDGNPGAWYAILTAPPDLDARGPVGSTSEHGTLGVEMRRVQYDHRALAAEMREVHLPEEFVETILTGWWTTCMEILPSRERARGRL